MGKQGERVEHVDENRIRELLVGHRVMKVDAEHLSLDDGTVLRVLPNSGCGGCPAGNYDIMELNACDNVIMSVDFEDDLSINDERETYGTKNPVSYPKYDDAHRYRIFVYAEDRRIKLLEVSGDDGNGYYGTGYAIWVTPTS